MRPLAVALLLAGTADAFTLPKASGFFNKIMHKPATASQPAAAQGTPLSTWLTGRRSTDASVALFATVERPGAAAASAAAAKDPIGDYVKLHGGDRPIRKILIANNGMAATKSIMSMRQWAYMEFGNENAIEFVAMATPEDMKANAEFIKLADSVVEVPGGKNANNYANVDVICKIAQTKGVDAVWPGWGHASEKPELPDTLAAMGIKFIGPNGSVMSALGDKIAANILAQTAKVPSIPWSGSWGGGADGNEPLTSGLNAEGRIPQDIFNKAMVTTVDEACTAAARIGYPVMLKASEGGGGKGIRMSDDEESLRVNFEQVKAEVPGSPMFMMQLCKGARHLEVQIVGDEHGNAVALNGRDCSTQRRFQKIFEEGPPIVAKPETFKKMERAAQRLTQSIGYSGAGTVEYLYNEEADEFYFLELNPRLQVEHPVTEGISLVNMPATQLQVAMGIPLNRIPDIRKFYALPADGDSAINFLEDDYRPMDTHVIAARITAENPDEGFKPTSGTIERVKFQSTTNVWGYFSVGANGGIHEFADSQFGHVFARGPTREAARKSLVLTLKQMEVRGEIRTTVDYLVQLLETEAFKTNKIDTAWLDGIIREKSVSTELDPHVTVACAAIYRAFVQATDRENDHVAQLAMGQMGMAPLATATKFPLDITYKSVKYPFEVQRTAADTFAFATLGADGSGGGTWKAQLRAQPDGSLLATFGGATRKIVGREEPLGLRVAIDSGTVYLPNVFDPSELRTDVTGKVVRFLQENGGRVEKGQPFVEVEAMKMIMPLKATESGVINHAMSAGSIIAAGDLLASLTLKDPGMVKKIEPFTGTFDMVAKAPADDAEALGTLLLAMAGYAPADGQPLEVLAQEVVLSAGGDLDTLATSVLAVVDAYLEVEALFDGRADLDAANLELVKANKDSLPTVVALNLAHRAIQGRTAAVAAMLRAYDELVSLGGTPAEGDAVKQRLSALASLQAQAYAPAKLQAASMLDKESVRPFATRLEELRGMLSEVTDLTTLSQGASLATGVELLSSLFTDSDPEVRAKALEAYVRRVYRAHTMTAVEVKGDAVSFAFKYGDVGPDTFAPLRRGRLEVLHSTVEDTSPAQMAEVVEAFATDLTGADPGTPGQGLHNLQLVFDMDANDSCPVDSACETKVIAAALALVQSQKAQLEQLGVRQVDVLVPQGNGADPRYFSFTQCTSFQEEALRRDMRPSWLHLLELGRLANSYELSRLASLGRSTQVYLGTEKGTGTKGPKQQVIFMRSIAHDASVLTTPEGAVASLAKSLDQLDRSLLDGRVTASTSSRIYLNLLADVEGTPKDAIENFKRTMALLQATYAGRLLQAKVDEIEIKIRCTDPNGELASVRLVASSMGGKWLEVQAFKEYPNPVTGVAQQFCPLGPDGELVGDACYLEPYPASSKLSLKRSIVRRISSTYAYDFLGLMEVDLVQKWGRHLDELKGAGLAAADATMPASLFAAKELILDAQTNELRDDVARPVGTNDVGMVAWAVHMKTPEYPEGRDIVVVANDVTVQSGSFGVKEDDFFELASQYARAHRLPRVYISCNSGARIGLVDSLKPLFKVAWKDDANPGAGFEYLYLAEADYLALPEGTVNAKKVDAPGGETRYELDAIIGQIHGIGVENLRGSGTIAGETARAYNDVFTLSYVTGRSVGIGAYLVRLGQRSIQMAVGPLILTGYGALNKLMGREVYTSNDQLGGPQVMSPNGVAHLVVKDDQAGVAAIMDWLAFVPKTAEAPPRALKSADPAARDVDFVPTKAPYDPRHMLAGAMVNGNWVSGFFDKGSFHEYLAEWGKSVVVGRARLGGMPVGVIAVETRLVEQRIPADPANPASREALQPQAGQVWYPDSAYKTAQAIADFGKGENLPLIIFANWRGFSGGTRDMAGEILKFGAMIVDALIKYEHPVQVYIPPHGELRGGAWVVIDPTINEEVMEMYCDQESRGGILEPPGICEVKFRAGEQLQKMHQLDPVLLQLDSEVAAAADDAEKQALMKQMKERETSLLPLYLQVAHEFADLHDRAGRMKAKGVVRDVLTFKTSREYMYWRIKRRVAEQTLVKPLQKHVGFKAATAQVSALFGSAYHNDQAFLVKLEKDHVKIGAALGSAKTTALAASVALLLQGLTQDQKDAVLAGL